MKTEMSENKKCEHCGDLATPNMNTCFDCRKRLVHEDVKSFIKKLQEAQEATRKHNTHFGPLPNNDN